MKKLSRVGIIPGLCLGLLTGYAQTSRPMFLPPRVNRWERIDHKIAPEIAGPVRTILWTQLLQNIREPEIKMALDESLPVESPQRRTTPRDRYAALNERLRLLPADPISRQEALRLDSTVRRSE